METYARHPLPHIKTPTRISAVRGNISSYLDSHHCPNVIVHNNNKNRSKNGSATASASAKLYSKRANSILGCALSHIYTLEKVIEVEETFVDNNNRQSANWYLVCEDDATGNFTELSNLLQERHKSHYSKRINAINLYSPKPSFKYGFFHDDHDENKNSTLSVKTSFRKFFHWDKAIGFGTRTTAYLITGDGAKWMLNHLKKWNETTYQHLCHNYDHNHKNYNIEPVDIALAKCPEGWIHALSYKGGDKVTGGFHPRKFDSLLH
eukprot:CAMPEP_0178898418 /NCGR_PEP_ID=MMETSP0786-20121207/2319_1 /TAXON_ID=186022 /ORGANISM="Thalassionema frauenfeldii, Strain CCMP 1798" /LENGTH=263 /DNA_ID=CAMNT_0020569133 /DNA_START=237 /DNA_END=1028 /DNA_ORIENTATION=-